MKWRDVNICEFSAVLTTGIICAAGSAWFWIMCGAGRGIKLHAGMTVTIQMKVTWQKGDGGLACCRHEEAHVADAGSRVAHCGRLGYSCVEI